MTNVMQDTTHGGSTSTRVADSTQFIVSYRYVREKTTYALEFEQSDAAVYKSMRVALDPLVKSVVLLKRGVKPNQDKFFLEGLFK